MNWEAIGAVGEVLGALGVIATLAYLAVQIRQNTRTVRSATHQAWVSSMTEVNMLLPQSREFARVCLTGSADPSKLDPEELLQFDMYIVQMFNGFEALYLQFLNGTVDATYWNTKLQNLRGLMLSPGVRNWWTRQRLGVYDPRFCEVVQRDVLSESADS